MKTTLISLSTILFCHSLQAQIVNIPDVNFKKYLVGNSNINTNLNSEIELTEAAFFIGTMNVSGRGIVDLTGIEAFTEFTWLDCSFNSLTSLDISKNRQLDRLQCFNNSLTSLDITKNTALRFLDCSKTSITSLDVSINTALLGLSCGSTSITSLDVSKNTALTNLTCDNNKLTSLDITKNTALTLLDCSYNSLTSLDIRNGNNVNMNVFPTNFSKNPSLKCIQVDNETWAKSNLSNKKDAQAVYSNDCKTIGVNEINLDAASITSYANIITINCTIGTITVFGLLGQQVHQSQLTSGTNNITINGSGVYLVIVQTVNGYVTKKVYLN
jgi:hypothetical protein